MSTGLKRISTKIMPRILMVILCLVPCARAPATQLSVKVSQIRVIKKSLYLDMAVWNCSGHPVVEQLADLPWGENAIGLVAYAAGPRGGQALMKAGPIADFPIKDVAIPPRSSVTGEINLSRLFPDLDRYRTYDDLVLFWVYDMSLIQGGEHAYVGGMLPFVPSSAGAASRSAANPCD